MQSASGGRDRLGNLPTVRMSQLLAHITVNQSRRGFICCDVSEWVKYLLRLALKKKTKHKTWDVSRVRSRQKAIHIQSAHISPFFCPMQMLDCRSPSEPDGWAECVAVPPPHTHTHFDSGCLWCGCWWGSHGSVALVLSGRPADTQDESFITTSCLARLADGTAGH